MTGRKTIVVSAVNIRKGGTLTILRECLAYLASEAGKYRVVALVHKRELCDYAGIEYIEMPDVIASWGRRLWCEYVTMHGISRQLSPVHLWLSLHDTTPRVEAERQAVYCQTSFPFLHWGWRDVRFDHKIVLFALFTRFAYRININRNSRLIVQTEWLRKGFARMFGLPESRFIVAPPRQDLPEVPGNGRKSPLYTFLFASTPDCHKNFETVCRAAELLEQELGKNRFRVILTIDGTENRYSGWVCRQWKHVSSIVFAGLMPREALYRRYSEADCLVFPSRVETWGLPISEFAAFGKPMLLADLPYAHETAAGSTRTAFFDVNAPEDLKGKMERLVSGDESFLYKIGRGKPVPPVAESWKVLFDLLLAE